MDNRVSYEQKRTRLRYREKICIRLYLCSRILPFPTKSLGKSIYNPILEESSFFVRTEVEPTGELDYSIAIESTSQQNLLVIDIDLQILFMLYRFDFEHSMNLWILSNL